MIENIHQNDNNQNEAQTPYSSALMLQSTRNFATFANSPTNSQLENL